MGVDGRAWRVGEVATATGLTVRALHHYDQIGLVIPSGRTPAGHRIYTEADLRKLYVVTALRQLGLSLEQVGRVLVADVDVRDVIDEQLAQVDRQIQAAERLREQLMAAREAEAVTDATRLMTVVKLSQEIPGYLSREQIEALHRRLTELGVVFEHAVTVEMPQLYAAALAEMRAGTPSSDPAVREIARRLDELARLLRGTDASIGAAVRRGWLERGQRNPDQDGGADWGALVAYLDQARAARDQ